MLKSMMLRALFGLSFAELTELMAGFGQKPYRARQVFEALYKQRVRSVEGDHDAVWGAALEARG